MSKIYYIDNSNKVNKSFLPEGIICLSPANYLAKKKDEADQLVVLCEIDINAKNETVSRTDFYGISFVQELRRNNYKNKVLFVSFLPEIYYKEKVLNAKILFFPGHSFLQIPVSPTEWSDRLKTFDSLTELSLYDAKHHFCGIEQIIDEQFHSLTPKYNSAEELTPDLIDEGTNLVKLVYKSLNKPVPELSKILHSNVSGTQALRSLKNLCEAVLPESIAKKHDKIQPEWKNWKVLWLDDEENKDSPLYKELVKRLGSDDKVIMCETYEKAESKWKEDEAYGEISLVICDYRLKKEGLPTSKQGYDFMKFLADDGRSVGKIAYSGLKRKFLIESFRHYGIQINIYSKIDFNQHNENDLAFLSDEIIRLGDNNWIEINNAPQAIEWSTIAPAYHSFKNGFSFYTFQNHISRLAKENLESFINEFNNQKTKEDLWKLTFIDSFKVRTGSFPEGGNKKTEAVKEILIARRFAIGLFAFLKSDKNKQRVFLHTGNYLDYIKVILYNSSSNGKGYAVGNLSDNKFFSNIKKDSTLKQLANKNAITFDSTWPLGLLPEEFGWLKFDMGLVKETYNEIYSYLRQVQIIKKSFQALFSQKPFNELITKKDGSVKIAGGKIHFSNDKIPLIRNTADAKKLVQSVYDSIDINDLESCERFVSFWRSLASQLIKGEFKESKLLSDFLYFISKTLKANKLDFSSLYVEYIKQDVDHLKELLETLKSVSEQLKTKSEKTKNVKTHSLNTIEEYKKLSPFSGGILKNILNAMLKPSDNKEALFFLSEFLGYLNTNNIEKFVLKISTSKFFPSYLIYSVEQEFIIKHRPWEIMFPKRYRLAADFKNVSNELLKAIELKKLTYLNKNLENRNNIFTDALTDLIRIYHNPNNQNRFNDLYFIAISYTRKRADLFNEQYKTDNHARVRKNGDDLSAIEYAENKHAQKSYQEQIEYYNNLLDQDENLRLDLDYYTENFDNMDAW